MLEHIASPGWVSLATIICLYLSLNVLNMATSTIRRLYPGPWFSRLTSFPLFWHEIRGSREAFIDGLHKNYGDLVQIAPRNISVNDVDSVRRIFAPGSRLDRPYQLTPFHNFGAENLVSTESGLLHQARRKCLRSAYNKNRTEAEYAQDTLEVALAGLHDYIDSSMQFHGHIDVKLMFRYIAANFMSRFVYGQQYDLHLLQNDTVREKFQQDITWQDERMKTISTLFQYLFPSFSSALQKIKWLPKWVRCLTPEDLFLNKVGTKVMEQRKRMSPEQKRNADGQDVLINRLIAAFEAEGPTEAIPNHEYILSDCMDHFWAGITTTADALSAVVAHLSEPEHAGLQLRLRTTLRAAHAHIQPTMPISIARDTKILDHIIRETLRTDPPVPTSMERRATADHPGELHGYIIQAGTTIGAQSGTFQRNPSVFADPDEWNPDRWDVPKASSAHHEMRRQLFAFGVGPRMCLGMNVAWAQMYVYLAWLYSRYETSLPDNSPAKAVERGPEMRPIVVFQRLECVS